ncbi:Uma2 family endonuclease [Streptomyces sp. CB01881]|uniref:Uma2 family endonuclease n=1 Tax=Streptomyces sp. CB01881 TaxID=2078691 RepID=UPI000CDC3938|nr:Uma2 family endonuclease [Streptomyces sp. CB01881]AUY49475.1 restriction endonuclease [Streptomyces sp. CB01881]TYC72859.1 Uma2 family endonuclease [Streptomyces sp. CB01881]
MSELPDWMYPPRDEGWIAEDLDHLPQAPRHTELIDGALVFRLSPQRWWHGELVTDLVVALRAQVPPGSRAGREMTIKLDRRNRPEPDVLVSTADYDPDRTWYAAGDVALVVEVVSPESAHRDRTVKVRKYAEAGIPHYWVIEDEDGRPVVHAYELDTATSSYAPAGIFRGRLERPVPFPVDIDLDALVPAAKRPERAD